MLLAEQSHHVATMSSDPVGAYLTGDSVPDFLKPITAMPMYSAVDVTAQTHVQDDKYQQYFNKLSLNPIDGFGDDGSFQPSQSDSAYMKKHMVWRPTVQLHDDRPSNKGTNFQSLFSAFANIPTLFTDSPLTGLSFHTTVQMNDGIHIYGGLRGLGNDEYMKKLKMITKNFTIPPENIKLIFDYDLPLPLEKDKFASIAHEPFTYHARYEPGCCALEMLVDLSNFDDHPDDFTSASSTQFSGLSGMKVPKSLCCASAAKLSERFYVLYGGFDLTEEIKHPDDNHCIIEKKIIVNDQFWVFDCLSLKYKEIKLSVHPTYASVFPSSIPRFGHCMSAVPIEETNNIKNINSLNFKSPNRKTTSPSGEGVAGSANSSTGESNRSEMNHTPTTPSTHVSSSRTGYSPQDVLNELKRNHNWYSNRKHSNQKGRIQFEKPSILFVMGGYTSTDKDSLSFVAINDLWKCEIFLDDFGVSDEIICCPIGSFDLLHHASFIINQNGENLPHPPNNDVFSGIFHHSESNGTQWPAPRGFFAMGLIAKNEIGQYFVDDIASSSTAEKPKQSNPLKILSPTPSKSSFIFNESHNKPSSPIGSPMSLKSQASIRLNLVKSRNNGNDSPSVAGSPIGYSINEKVEGLRTSPFSMDNNDRVNSTSPFSELGIHTSQIPELSSKILIAHAGSSIMFTKVIDEETGEETTFYNKRVLGDFWWFDFQTEKWHFHETLYQNTPMNLNICGHLLVPGEENLTVLGGLQERHYDDEEFNLMVHALPEPDSKLDPNIYRVAKDFSAKIRGNQNANKDQSIDEFQRSAGLSHEFSAGRQYPLGQAQCYTSYILDIPKRAWKTVDYAYVRNIHMAKIWEKGDPLISGGVCSTNAQYYKNLEDCPFYMIYTISFIGLYDSKIIALVNDAHLMDRRTDKHANVRQCVWANGIAEIYSSFLST